MGAQLAATVAAVVCSGCLLPPEGLQLDERINHAPEVDPTSLRPIESSFNVFYDCTAFDVSARARDKDDATLRFRFVANAGFSDARHIKDEIREPDIGRYAEVSRVIVPNEDFSRLYDLTDPTGAATDQVGVLSLFITDADEWAVTAEEAQVETENLGAIVNPPTDGGLEPFSVVEVRWTLKLRTSSGNGACP